MLNFTFKVLPFGSRSYLSAAGLYFWRRASGSGFKLSFLTFPVAHDCSAIMTCVTSVRYFQFASMGRCRRPFPRHAVFAKVILLSPYLFLFIADGLSQLIHRKVQDNTLLELKICRGGAGYIPSPLCGWYFALFQGWSWTGTSCEGNPRHTCEMHGSVAEPVQMFDNV